MAYEIRPNTGSLFKNDKKEADTHPDYKGSGLIEGVGEVWLDAWINTSNSGVKYMSLKFKPKDQAGSYARQEPTQRRTVESVPSRFDADLNDDVPF
jgi:uncharacterized protein (DUF736 family)